MDSGTWEGTRDRERACTLTRLILRASSTCLLHSAEDVATSAGRASIKSEHQGKWDIMLRNRLLQVRKTGTARPRHSWLRTWAGQLGSNWAGLGSNLGHHGQASKGCRGTSGALLSKRLTQASGQRARDWAKTLRSRKTHLNQQAFSS